VMLAIWHQWQGRQGSKYEPALLALLLMASVAVPMTFRGPGTAAAPPPRDARGLAATAEAGGEGRVTLLLFEGASLDVIAPAAADGRLPHFGRLVESAAFMHVATIRPTQPGTVWTAAATGKLPVKNGIRSAALYWPVGSAEAIEVLPDSCFAHALVRFGFLRQQIHSSGDLTARPLWNILSQQGVAVGIVNWSITQPARQVLGYQVSDEFERLAGTSVDLEGTQSAWPREAVAVAAAAVIKPGVDSRGSAATAGSDASELIATTCRSDRVHEQMTTELEGQFPSRFRAVRYRCLDAAGHYLLRYAVPNPFGDVSEEDVQRYNAALGGFYATADAAIGRALAGMRPGDLLIVMSGFGMDPMEIGKRLLEKTFGNPVPSGTHERAPDGFLFAFGSGVEPGRLSRASIVDLVPTVLYFFGLPVGRDMDGFARTDIFSRDFTTHRPITYIPTYER
jgi:predicted AlkP superfamily phosphohydrolase/phosphomutase